MKSKLCDLLNIKYPIIQGGMQWLATPEFAAEVSNAGGLGTINSSLYKSKDELKDAIRKTREALEQKRKQNSGSEISFSNSSAIWTSISKTLFRFITKIWNTGFVKIP